MIHSRGGCGLASLTHRLAGKLRLGDLLPVRCAVEARHAPHPASSLVAHHSCHRWRIHSAPRGGTLVESVCCSCGLGRSSDGLSSDSRFDSRLPQVGQTGAIGIRLERYWIYRFCIRSDVWTDIAARITATSFHGTARRRASFAPGAPRVLQARSGKPTPRFFKFLITSL